MKYGVREVYKQDAYWMKEWTSNEGVSKDKRESARMKERERELAR